ncbi:hypothetical protein WDZ16_01485 [Pseudokineococcus marinus]|uniref:Uncharacterized protein n=1 Tax=Pseudokineococcus marinus TaxID=351215 RepID=A0A849BM50_9ACTN|nr:hypothetical protein [Pseudokineococcus marinus]NNH22413.1 hypothetical protein [Pseudokineococcus marinus]
MTTTPTDERPAPPAPRGEPGAPPSTGAAGGGPARHVLGLLTPHLRRPAEVDHAAASVAAVAGLPSGSLVGSSLVLASSGSPQHLGLVVLAPEPLPAEVATAVAAAAGAEAGGAWVAARAAAGTVDRVAVFPGREDLVGVLAARDLLALSAVEALVGLGGLAVPPDAVVDTRGHVRPRLADGRLVLDVQPSRGGRWVPFEPPVQHACCSAH